MPALVIFVLINGLFELVVWFSSRKDFAIFIMGGVFYGHKIGIFFARLFQDVLLVNVKLASLSLLPSELHTYFSLGPRFCSKQ